MNNLEKLFIVRGKIMKKEKFKFKKKNKIASIPLTLVVFILIILLIAISYAKWESTLIVEGNVIGKESELPVDPVKPSEDSDRFTTNTSLTAGAFGYQVFTLVGDTVEGNVITTKLANGSKTWLTTNMTATFSLTIQNNSGTTYTDGNVTYEKEDSQGYINPQSQTLSSATITSGQTTTLECKVKLRANSNINVGSYVLYKIEFATSTGKKQYYYYKILISA